jgi:hypothetical protein
MDPPKFAHIQNEDDYDLFLGDRVITITFQGQQMVLKGHCMLDYGTAYPCPVEYCTLYTDFGQPHHTHINYDIDRRSGLTLEEIVDGLNKAIAQSN